MTEMLSVNHCNSKLDHIDKSDIAFDKEADGDSLEDMVVQKAQKHN